MSGHRGHLRRRMFASRHPSTAPEARDCPTRPASRPGACPASLHELSHRPDRHHLRAAQIATRERVRGPVVPEVRQDGAPLVRVSRFYHHTGSRNMTRVMGHKELLRAPPRPDLNRKLQGRNLHARAAGYTICVSISWDFGFVIYAISEVASVSGDEVDVLRHLAGAVERTCFWLRRVAFRETSSRKRQSPISSAPPSALPKKQRRASASRLSPRAIGTRARTSPRTHPRGVKNPPERSLVRPAPFKGRSSPSPRRRRCMLSRLTLRLRESARLLTRPPPRGRPPRAAGASDDPPRRVRRVRRVILARRSQARVHGGVVRGGSRRDVSGRPAPPRRRQRVANRLTSRRPLPPRSSLSLAPPRRRR